MKKAVLGKQLNPLSTSVRLVCSDNISIASVSGIPDIGFKVGAGSQTYYDLKRLATLADFTENSNYEFARLVGVKLELIRS